jgi:hypothetical protein
MRPTDAPLDVTAEELEALLEGVREALGEAGYQKLQAAMPKRIAERTGSTFHIRRCIKGTDARSASAAKCTRCTIRACWCECKVRRRSQPPCTSWRSCAAICVGKCSRPKFPQAWARRSTTRRRPA